MEIGRYRRHRGVTRLLAVAVPLVVSGVLHLAGGLIANSAGALVLVLCVVAAAATGDRLASAIAALSSVLGFDFFLTQPYLQLRIASAEDVELAVLLLLVGLAVSELAAWGLRQNAAATEQAGFVRGALESADLAAGSTSLPDALERVAGTIRALLGADGVTFERGDHDAAAAVIQRDGSVRHQRRPRDIALNGLPRSPGGYSAIPVVQGGAQVGYFRVTTGSDLRPSRDALRVAVLLAGQFSHRLTPWSGAAAGSPRHRNEVAGGHG